MGGGGGAGAQVTGPPGAPCSQRLWAAEPAVSGLHLCPLVTCLMAPLTDSGLDGHVSDGDKCM